MELPCTGNQQPSGDPATVRSAAASPAPDIRLLGPVGVAFTDVDPSWTAGLARTLGPLHPGDAPVFVRLRTTGRVERPAGGAVELYPGVLAWREGAHLVLADEASGLVGAARAGAKGVVELHQPQGRPHGDALRRLLLPLLAQPLLAAGVHLVHAAAFVAGGRAVLVAGGTGSGKSTTGAAARHAGHELLADDVVVLWQEAGRWWVEGVHRPVQVPVELDPEALGPLDADQRGRVSPPDWLSGGRAAVAGVVLPVHAAGAGGLGPADPAEVGRRLFGGSFAVAWPGSSGPALAMAAALGRLPARELALDGDAGVRLSRAASGLAELVAAL